MIPGDLARDEELLDRTTAEREAQLAILIGSLLAAGIGIAILLTSKATQAAGPK